MKSIIRIIASIFFLASSINPNAQTISNKQSILLQANDKSISEESLKQSVAIISKRLIAYGYEQPEIKIDKVKAQLSIQIQDKTGVKLPTFLVESKGTIGFYETYNREELNNLTNNNKSLLAFLSTVEMETHNANSIVCITMDKLKEINQQLRNFTENKYFKFAWSQEPENEKVCLYALKLAGDIDPILKSNDIIMMNISNDPASGQNRINMEFNKDVTARWAKLTARNIDKAIAVTIDNNVFFAPILKSVIENGKFEITGNFTLQQLKLFSAIASNGELPVSFTFIK